MISLYVCMSFETSLTIFGHGQLQLDIWLKHQIKIKLFGLLSHQKNYSPIVSPYSYNEKINKLTRSCCSKLPPNSIESSKQSIS